MVTAASPQVGTSKEFSSQQSAGNTFEVVTVGQPQVQRPYRDPKQVRKNTLQGLGITEVVLGGLSLILAVIALAITTDDSIYHHGYKAPDDDPFSHHYSTSSGIWSGAVVIATGVAGIAMKFKTTKNLLIANLIMAIASSIISCVAGYLSAMLVSHKLPSVTLTILYSLICILFFTTVLLGIAHAVACYSGVCYRNGSGGNQLGVFQQTHSNAAAVQLHDLPQTSGHVVTIPSSTMQFASYSNVQPHDLATNPSASVDAPSEPAYGATQ